MSNISAKWWVSASHIPETKLVQKTKIYNLDYTLLRDWTSSEIETGSTRTAIYQNTVEER